MCRNIRLENFRNDRGRSAKKGAGARERVVETESERVVRNVGKSKFTQIAAIISGSL